MNHHTHLISIIQLFRSKNVGCLTFQKAIRQFGSADKAISEISRDNCALQGKKIDIYPRNLAEQEFYDGIKSGASCVAFDDALFPKMLSEIYDCPPFLWGKGNISLLNKDSCAIVGARNASVGGRKIAYTLAKNLGINHFITVSGLANGIDTASHQGSLEHGTIAVMASGINHIYPNENKALATDIINHNGLIISEAPPNTPPQANMFIRRNRIISGLSLGVVIVEAGYKSGSLSTAEFGIEHNREIFAVPGNPLDSRSAGTNNLLRNGANWVEKSEDVICILQGIIQKRAIKSTIEFQSHETNTVKQIFLNNMPKAIHVDPILPYPEKQDRISNKNKDNIKHDSAVDNIETLILGFLSTSPISSDDLIRLCQMPASKILPILTELEILGDITRHHGNMLTKTIKKLAL